MTYLRSQSYQVLESGNKYEPLLFHGPCYLTLFYNVNSYLLSILSFLSNIKPHRNKLCNVTYASVVSSVPILTTLF